MKKNSKWIVLLVIGLLVVVGLLVGYPYLKNFWNKPLGEVINLPTFTPTNNSAQINTAPSQTAQGQRPSNTPTVSPQCDGPCTLFIEALGVNDDIEGGDHLADVIRIVRVDFVTPSVIVLDIPRDIWVKYPTLSDPRIQYAKINQATQFGINAAWRNYQGTPLFLGPDGQPDPSGGPGLMARVLADNFGLRVDNYGMVGFDAFIKIVDAVGGIDIYLPEAVDGTAHPGDTSVPELGYFPAGEQHLNGQQALNLARIRKCGVDCTTFTRTSNQNLVLCALREKIMAPSVLPSIPNIVASLYDSFTTDLSPAQISQLITILPNLKKENIIFTEPPESDYSRDSIFDTYNGYTTSIIRTLPSFSETVQKFINGTWPVPDTSSSGSFCP